MLFASDVNCIGVFASQFFRCVSGLSYLQCFSKAVWWVGSSVLRVMRAPENQGLPLDTATTEIECSFDIHIHNLKMVLYFRPCCQHSLLSIPCINNAREYLVPGNVFSLLIANIKCFSTFSWPSKG